MQQELETIKKNIKPKNRFWKLLGKIGVFVIAKVIKNQKGVNPDDVDKGVEIINETLE